MVPNNLGSLHQTEKLYAKGPDRSPWQLYFWVVRYDVIASGGQIAHVERGCRSSTTRPGIWHSVGNASFHPIGLLLASQGSGFIEVSEGPGGKARRLINGENTSLSGQCDARKSFIMPSCTTIARTGRTLGKQRSMNQPSVFISCVSPEFRQTRGRVAEILTRLGYTPVIQEIFGTEPGDLRQVLRDKIDFCEGLIQIVG